MITGRDLYKVMTAMVPLYVAMMLAYASVKWWKIFTPEQCAGINKFVALFAIPLLSFNFISQNNPYEMNLRFIAADTLQKIIVLVSLSIWAKFSSKGSIDWLITLFAIATLPNTLVIGVPLLDGMYGSISAALMVQIVVLQCIVWNTFLLILFECRGAKLLISERFPENASQIGSFKVDSDVISLDGKKLLETSADLMEDGTLHIKVSRSASDVTSKRTRNYGLNNMNLNKPYYFNDAETHSLSSSRFQSSRKPSCSFNHNEEVNKELSTLVSDEEMGEPNLKGGVATRVHPLVAANEGGGDGGDDRHMFVRSASAPHVSGGGGSIGFKGVTAHELSRLASSKDYVDHPRDECSSGNDPQADNCGGDQEGPKMIRFPSSKEQQTNVIDEPKPTAMPPTGVITKLILTVVWRKLIRNPNTYSSVLGLIWSLIACRWHVEMPAIIAQSIHILSNAGLGMAMFSVGLFMAMQPKMIACGKAKAGLASAVRFLVGPAVMAVASVAVGIRGTLLKVAIVQAVLPQGIVPFVFAKEYNLHADIVSTAVISGLLVTIPVALVYYILLGLVH